MKSSSQLITKKRNSVLENEDYVLINKRFKSNKFIAVPQPINNYNSINDKSQNIYELFEFLKQRNYPLDLSYYYFKNKLMIEKTINIIDEFHKIFESLNGIILIFFGAVNFNHLINLSNCGSMIENKYNIKLIGVTANAKENLLTINSKINLPIISDDKGSFARFLKISDPLGGGSYPLDTIMLLDFNGIIKGQIKIKSQFCKGWNNGVNEDEMIVQLIECLDYLKQE